MSHFEKSGTRRDEEGCDSTGVCQARTACTWILAPGGAGGGYQDVTLFFTEFLLTSRDSLHLYSCGDMNCTSKSQGTMYRGNMV